LFLTGFDSKKLNTLYVDKNLEYHGLLQAFSRTNRILNEKKRLSENELAERSIQLLKKFTDQVVTFDLQDALGKLSRFGLADVDSKGEWGAVPLNDASAVLAEFWTRQFGKKNPLQRIKKIFEHTGKGD
jgi:hypothetical protein